MNIENGDKDSLDEGENERNVADISKLPDCFLDVSDSLNDQPILPSEPIEELSEVSQSILDFTDDYSEPTEAGNGATLPVNDSGSFNFDESMEDSEKSESESAEKENKTPNNGSSNSTDDDQIEKEHEQNEILSSSIYIRKDLLDYVKEKKRLKETESNLAKCTKNQSNANEDDEPVEKIRTSNVVESGKKDSSETAEVENKRRSSRILSKSVMYSETADFDGEEEPSVKKMRSETVEKREKDSPETTEVETKRRSSRNISKSVKYTETVEDSEDSDEEEEPSVKKMRSDAVERTDKKRSFKPSSRSQTVNRPNGKHRSYNDLECPECTYCTRYPKSWVKHLKNEHSTTPTLAGFLLRCDCGHDSFSERHSRKCEISNFTVVRNGDGPIRRLTDDMMTPQCILCENYPRTACGYTSHLNYNHKTTLKANYIYLVCSCGLNITSHFNNSSHDKNCDGLRFTLHKIPLVTPQCILCEKYPTTPHGYTDHLRSHHKTTLKANGIYIKCLCGFRVTCKDSHVNHDKECDRRKFTLHKRAD